MVQMAIRVFIIFIVFIFSQSGVATADDSTFLSKFQGEWISDGNAFGRPAKSTMVWSSTLNEKFIHLDYNIIMGVGKKTSVFQGTAFYKSIGHGEYTAFWADNAGELHPIKAKMDGNALVSIWGVEGAKLGRTRYELLNDHLTVTDWIKIGDDWRQFNNNAFTLVPSHDSTASTTD